MQTLQISNRRNHLGIKNQQALNRGEQIERFHEAIAYHQGKIADYEREIQVLEGKTNGYRA